MADTFRFPKLRSIEVHPSKQRPGGFELTDPSGVAPGTFTVSPAAMSIIVNMDGKHDKPAIQVEFMRRLGRMLMTEELDGLLEQMDEAYLLESPRFEARLAELLAEYRNATCRSIRDADALGAPPEKLGGYLDSILQRGSDFSASHAEGELRGFVAPHLDYERGAPCYAAAYRDLADRTNATRFVVLGANHFGSSASVVATTQGFETPFGIVPSDSAFIERLTDRLKVDLCENEYDHVREHSIELQAVMLRHVLGDRAFSIAPFLCPDICGASGTAPRNGKGADLSAFADALRAEIEADECRTVIIAGADLSHVGRYFEDNRDLNADRLHAVETSDRDAIETLMEKDAERFHRVVVDRHNDTHICSVGALYVLSKALAGRAKGRILTYHQAVTQEIQNCVSCAAIEFVGT